MFLSFILAGSSAILRVMTIQARGAGWNLPSSSHQICWLAVINVFIYFIYLLTDLYLFISRFILSRDYLGLWVQYSVWWRSSRPEVLPVKPLPLLWSNLLTSRELFFVILISVVFIYISYSFVFACWQSVGWSTSVEQDSVMTLAWGPARETSPPPPSIKFAD